MNTTPHRRPRRPEGVRALAQSVLSELRKAGYGPEDEALFLAELLEATHSSARASKAA